MVNKDVKSTNGGGLVPVTTLPEKGNVGTLYKTPDGSVYYWFHEETKKEVEVSPTLDVGKTYEMRDEMTFIDFGQETFNLAQKLFGREVGTQDFNFEFDSETPFTTNGNLDSFAFYYVTREAPETGPAPINIGIGFSEMDTGSLAEFNVNVSEPHTDDEIININLNNVTLPVLITLNQEFADWFEENNATLQDIAFLFKGKTETVTVVNEGYIKVGGLFVLDSKNISDNTIYNDTYYNAKTIINNALKGVNFVLKEEDSSGQSVHFSKMIGFGYGKDPEGIYSGSINFDGRTIFVNDTNFYAPETITGKKLKEQMRFIQGDWGLDFNGARLMAYIEDSGQVSEEEAQKLMAPGTIISLFDGLITLDYILSTGEESDHIDYELYLASPTQPMGEQFGRFKGEPCLGNVNCSRSSISVGFDWSNIEDSKEYSTDIIIKFADTTTKAIKTTKSYISAIFKQNIPA